MSGVKRWAVFAYIDDEVAELDEHEEEDGQYVLASDYDRLEQECVRLRSVYEEDTRRITGVNALADDLKAERDELRAQVEAMRDALRDAAKGVHWLQAHVPMTKDAQWHAYHTRDDIESALQPKP